MTTRTGACLREAAPAEVRLLTPERGQAYLGRPHARTTVTADAAGNLSYAGGTIEPTAKAEGSTEMSIAVTVDKDGNPTEMTTSTAIDGGVSTSIESIFTKDDPTAKAEYGRVYEATIDMTNPQSAKAGYDMALAVGIPIYNVGATASGNPPIKAFLDEAKKNGTLTRGNMSKGSTKDVGVDLSAKVKGINFGLGYSDTTDTTSYSKSQYWDGSRYIDWKTCQGR